MGTPEVFGGNYSVEVGEFPVTGSTVTAIRMRDARDFYNEQNFDWIKPPDGYIGFLGLEHDINMPPFFSRAVDEVQVVTHAFLMIPKPEGYTTTAQMLDTYPSLSESNKLTQRKDFEYAVRTTINGNRVRWYVENTFLPAKTGTRPSYRRVMTYDVDDSISYPRTVVLPPGIYVPELPRQLLPGMVEVRKQTVDYAAQFFKRTDTLTPGEWMERQGLPEDNTFFFTVQDGGTKGVPGTWVVQTDIDLFGVKQYLMKRFGATITFGKRNPNEAYINVPNEYVGQVIGRKGAHAEGLREMINKIRPNTYTPISRIQVDGYSAGR